MVEQRTHKPRVPRSIRGTATKFPWRLNPIAGRASHASRQQCSPSLSIHSTHLRKPTAAERHFNSARTVRLLNGSSHRRRRFGAGPPLHSQNRRRQATCPSYALGLTLDIIFVFGRTRRLHTADINSCPPLRLTRFRHSRTESRSTLARYNSLCILRTCPFKKSTVRSKSMRRSTR